MCYDLEDFTRDVVEQSDLKPVVVEFWAPWCAPCRSLGLIVKRLALEAGRAWALVRVDIGRFPTLAPGHDIVAPPALKLYVCGRAIAEITGVPTEAELRVWLQQNLPEPDVDPLSQAARWIQAGNAREAFDLLTTLLETNKDDGELAALSARSLVFSDPDSALALIDEFEPDEPSEPAFRIVRIFARLFSILDDPASFLAESPLRNRYLSGILALRRQRFDDSLRHLIAVVEEVPDYDGGGARTACHAIFDHLGRDHAVARQHLPKFRAATER